MWEVCGRGVEFLLELHCVCFSQSLSQKAKSEATPPCRWSFGIKRLSDEPDMKSCIRNICSYTKANIVTTLQDFFYFSCTGLIWNTWLWWCLHNISQIPSHIRVVTWGAVCWSRSRTGCVRSTRTISAFGGALQGAGSDFAQESIRVTQIQLEHLVTYVGLLDLLAQNCFE